MNAIRQILTGPSGNLSSRRVQMLFVTFLVGIVWAYVSIKKGELQEPSEWLVAWMLGSGALVAYKGTAKP